MGLTDRMETVTSLEMNQETGGMDINGVRDSIPDTSPDLPIFPMDTIVVYPDTMLEFLCKGKSYSYRVRNKPDMYRIISEVNFLLELEKI
jgi:hypothetical protein